MAIRGRTSGALLAMVVLLTGCGTTEQATPSAHPVAATAYLTLSPVPLMLSVPARLADKAWVAPLTGDYIESLAPSAAVQVQFLTGSEVAPMIANLMWFTDVRYEELMATADAPKGIRMGVQDGFVLFVQPALDMPFDPASQQGKDYGALVERARSFSSYRMSDPTLTLLRK